MIERSSPDDTDEAPTIYEEPAPDDDSWPDEWSRKQRQNWRSHGQPVYEELTTDAGRYWYRRTWRPKMQLNGMILRDHVGLHTPEDYVASTVERYLGGEDTNTNPIYKRIGALTADTDKLNTAIEDIVQARIQVMPPDKYDQLAEPAREIADTYGISIEPMTDSRDGTRGES